MTEFFRQQKPNEFTQCQHPNPQIWKDGISSQFPPISGMQRAARLPYLAILLFRCLENEPRRKTHTRDLLSPLTQASWCSHCRSADSTRLEDGPRGKRSCAAPWPDALRTLAAEASASAAGPSASLPSRATCAVSAAPWKAPQGAWSFLEESLSQPSPAQSARAPGIQTRGLQPPPSSRAPPQPNSRRHVSTPGPSPHAPSPNESRTVLHEYSLHTEEN